MKESEFETKQFHLRTYAEINAPCDHDYQFVLTVGAIRDGKGNFIFNALYQCCKCMKIGVVEQREFPNSVVIQ